MPTNLQILCLGAAAVLDTVLLLAVVERRNRRYVMTPVLLLILGGWFWHTGAFAYALLGASDRPWKSVLTLLAMVVMSTGLLVMPSAMLHGIWRIGRTGLQVLTPTRFRYAWAYLPLLAIVPIAWHLSQQSATARFIDRVWPVAPFYAVWLSAVGIAAAIGFLRLRRQADSPASAWFYSRMALVLVGLIALHACIFLIALPLWPQHGPFWLVVVILSPVIPALVFAYYVIRYDFMQVVVERSLVYAAILLAGLLLHEMLIRPVTSQLTGQFGLNFTIIEVVLVIGLIVLYQPLRQRASEALRYLMGERVAPMRDRTRRMAVRMSENALMSREALLEWFVAALREAVGVRYVIAWLAGDQKDDAFFAGDISDAIAADARAIHKQVADQQGISCSRRDAGDQVTLDHLRSASASLAVLLRHQQVDGLLLLGKTTGNRDLTDEETNAVVLLGEQLAVTLHVGSIQADRLAAERRALQSEKLAMLGLVASSIAHEVKNPLSSIKTIATVLAEDLGPADPRSQDVQLIREEIDRLSVTTSRLLRFARPAAGSASGSTAAYVSVTQVLLGTLHVMNYLARERGVTVDSRIQEDLPPVAAEEDALREIFTNLLSNAIEAAGGRGGTAAVTVTIQASNSNGTIGIEIADDGPGLPPAVRERLYEPFVTTRQNGTGLGLYIVGRRVKEIGGTIRCDDSGGRGTTFVITLPMDNATTLGAQPV